MIDMLDKIGGSSPLEEEDPNRPAWIPLSIVADWDPCPYAYQTEEELMSQGALHDLLMTYISQVMPNHLAQYGLVLWKDIFMLYRDSREIKKRVAPDLLLAKENIELKMESWNLDHMPVPEFLGEITSRRSRKQDLGLKCELYHKLGVRRYLVIDGHDGKGNINGDISIRVWKNGREQKADKKGFLHIPELHVKARPLDTDLVFYHEDTLEPLLDIKTAKQRLSELVNEKESLASEKDSLVSEKESLVSEKESLVSEKESLVSEKESLASEKESLVSENTEQARKIHELEERLRKSEE